MEVSGMLMAKQLRKNAGFSQEKAAQLLGINRTILSKIENEKHELSSVVLFKMMRLYNVPAEKILGVNPIENKLNFRFRNIEKLDNDAKRVFSRIEKIVENLVFLESIENEKI
jgi:transcriptional regulator with XRE-family HTH domain